MTRGLACFTLVSGLFACDDTTSRPPRLGERCAVERAAACAEGLVCVDGLCRARELAEEPAEKPLPPLATFEVWAPSDTSDTGTFTDIPDIAEPADTAPVTERITLTTYDPARPSDIRLALATGQAAAVELFIPSESRPEHLTITAFRPDGPACGLFRALAWLPRTIRPDGTADFDLFPDLIGPALPVSTNAEGPTLIDLPFPDDLAVAALARGPHRVGARYEGPCTTSATAPFIELDASGETTNIFIWAEAWIAGTDLGLPGRWAFALQLRVGQR